MTRPCVHACLLALTAGCTTVSNGSLMPTTNTHSAELRVEDEVWPMSDVQVGLLDVVPGAAACDPSWRLGLATHGVLEVGQVSVELQGQVSDGFLDGAPMPVGDDDVWLRSVGHDGAEHAWSGGEITWLQTDLAVVVAFRQGSWCLDRGACEAVDVDLACTLVEPLVEPEECLDAAGPDAFGRCVWDGGASSACDGTLP